MGVSMGNIDIIENVESTEEVISILKGLCKTRKKIHRVF